MSAFLSIDSLSLHICRLGGIGRAPVAPGTCAAAVAALLAPWLFLPLSFGARGIVLAVIFLFGALLATRAERCLEQIDPGQVVIDELLGMWVVLWPFTQASWGVIILAFILFRVFDIAKIWPVNASETWLPGGFGVMLDDVLAGVQAFLVLALLVLFGPF